MFTTRVIFDNNIEESREIDFLILPKIGETIAYGDEDTKYYRVENIVHTIDSSSNKGKQQLNIYASKICGN